jgi:hypothetical protein
VSFTISLAHNGVYSKDGGAPLKPGQCVLLDDGLFDLPQHFEEIASEDTVMREWHIPVARGHYLLREFLPRERRSWPW